MANAIPVRPSVVTYHITLALILLSGIIGVTTPMVVLRNQPPGVDTRITIQEEISMNNGAQESRARFIMGSVISSIGIIAIVIGVELAAVYGAKITKKARLVVGVLFTSISAIFFIASFSLYIAQFGNGGPRSYFTGFAFMIIGGILSLLAVVLCFVVNGKDSWGPWEDGANRNGPRRGVQSYAVEPAHNVFVQQPQVAMPQAQPTINNNQYVMPQQQAIPPVQPVNQIGAVPAVPQQAAAPVAPVQTSGTDTDQITVEMQPRNV